MPGPAAARGWLITREQFSDISALADVDGWRQLDGIALSIEDTDDQFFKPGLALRLRLRNGTPVPADVTATANRAEMIVVVANSVNVRDHERWEVVALVTATALAHQP